ncbi:MAG: hypothetical protein GX905_01030 [Bacteroidales bacterium]|nr:hypothetical protein [Bacteroidales bacterium]
MFETILITILIVGLAIALLAFNIIRGKKFPNTHVSGNKALRKRGITCAQSQDRQAQNKPQINY